MAGLQRVLGRRWQLNSFRKARVAAITLVALAALIGPQPIHAENPRFEAGIEGSWLLTVTIPGGPPPFRSLETFGGGGAFVATSSGPPAMVSSAHGTWTRTGPREFVVTFLQFQYDAAGVHSGYLRVRERRRLGSSGNVFSGTGTFENLDTDFNVLLSGDVTTHGTRIVP